MTRREQQRERIITTAFKVWGSSRFSEMSLSTLAEELALTKPALYRYFTSKDELLAALSDRCAEDYISLTERLFDFDIATETDSGPRAGLETKIFAVVEIMHHFLDIQPEYAPFFITQLIAPDGFARTDLKQVVNRQHETLLRAVRMRFPHAAHDLIETAPTFILFTALFWAMVTYVDENLQPRSGSSRDATMIEASISRAYEVCTQGLLITGARRLPEFAAVESSCGLGPETRLEPDRILSAIAEVVGEFGLFEATIERIAERVGMSKSSLYFYFKNKDEMLVKMAQRIRMHFFDLLLDRLENFSTVEDRVYAFLVLSAGYMLHNPELLTVTHWFRAQNLDIELDDATLERATGGFAFLQQALYDGLFRAGADELVSVVSYFHLFVMHDGAYFRSDIRDEDILHRHMRSLYILSMGGVQAAAVVSPSITSEGGSIS